MRSPIVPDPAVGGILEMHNRFHGPAGIFLQVRADHSTGNAGPNTFLFHGL